MRKKIICFILAALMILPFALTGCGNDKEEDDEKHNGTTNASAGGTKARTITIYCPTSDDTTEEGIAVAQSAINLYTEGTYYTRIFLKLYPESEYYDVLEEKLAQHQKDVDEGKTKKHEAGEERKEAEEEIEESGEAYGSTIVYPELNDPQVDIFVVQGRDKLIEYANAGSGGDTGYLMPIGSYLEVNYKLIKKYISPSYLSTGSIGTNQLGIPNNHVMGEYTYLLLNKEVTDSLYFTPEEVASSSDKLHEYLSDARKYYGSYIPMYNYPTDNSVHITKNFSLLGGVLSDGTYENTQLLPTDLLGYEEYVEYLKQLNMLKNGGFVTEGDPNSLPEGKKVAAAFIKGGYGLEEVYGDDYYVVPVNDPVAKEDEYPGSFLCVSPYTYDVDRCVKIIEALTTDKTLRNLFQYGAEGTHYTVDYNGVYQLIDNPELTYKMDPINTGNEFIMAQNSNMDKAELSLSANDWANAKAQSISLMRSPYTFFTLEEITKENYWKKSMYWAYSDTAEFNEKMGINPELLSKEDLKKKQDEARDMEPFFDYPCAYTAEMLEFAERESKRIYDQILAYNGGDFEGYVESLREDFENETLYKAFVADETGDLPVREDYGSDADYAEAVKAGPNADSPLAQYKRFYEESVGLR